MGEASSRLSELDNEELEILKFRGAFLLPPRDLCDDLIEAFFEKIHPTMPILNRSKFMRSYNNPSNPPSLLLLQAILLAGSRVCRSHALLDSEASADLASLTFYKRAKALFDANYETDRITIVQSVMLLSWWWEGPEDVTRNSFYWSRVALSIAQGFGLHRSMENTNMPVGTKRTWKKMWWALFARDRWGAVALGRPVLVNLEDSDVPMLTEEDFIEDEPGLPALYPVNRTNILAFIHTVKLSEIMGMVLKQQFSINAEISRRQNRVPVVSHCDMAMGSWMKNLPPELKYSVKDKANHNFFVATLHAQYYTVLCLVHRSNVLRKGSQNSNNPYPSWGIAFQAAHMISRIVENLIHYDEIKDCSVFYIYTVFSAMIMLLYQTDSPIPSVVESAKKAFETCMVALNEMGKQWMVARMLQRLFKPLNSSKTLRDQYVNDSRKRAYNAAGQDGDSSKKPKAQKTSGTKGPELDQRASISPLDNFSQTPSAEHIRKASPRQKDSNIRSTLFNTPPMSGTDHRPSPLHFNSHSPTNVDGQSPVARHDETWNKASGTHGTSGPLPFPPSAKDFPDSLDPDFLFVTTARDSNSFYQNFRPSQLFPESNDGDRGSLADAVRPFGNESAGSTSSMSEHATPQAYSALHGSGMPINGIIPSANNSPMGEAGTSPAISIGHANPMNSANASLKEETSKPTSEEGMVPSTLNLNDWYHYLTSTFQNVQPQNHPLQHTNGTTDGETPLGDQMMTDLLDLNENTDNGVFGE